MEMEIMVMDGVPDLLDFSEHTTTTINPTYEEDDCNWNQWSPLLNFESFTNDPDDFHSLIDNFMDDFDPAGNCLPSPDHGSDGCISVSTATTEDDGNDGDLKGLRLVHLLMAAAEALTGATACLELVRVILVRLKELVSPTHGTTMERLATHFTDALHSLLEGALGARSAHKNSAPGGTDPDNNHNQMDMLAAFQLLHDMSPYIKFAHFTANQAILEAVAHERRVHIVDYDIMEGAQWAALIQAFSSSKNGTPGPHLRITALSRGGRSGQKSFAKVQETGRRLTAFASSLGQPFSFHHFRLDSDETFRPLSLKVVRGEALVFNCMLNLPHLNYRAHDSVASFLSGAKSLGSKVVTLVEEVRTVGETGFVGRFMDSLHHYSAIYDSLEAGFPMQSRARALVERIFLGPRIVGSLARIYQAGGEERGSWGEWLGAVGFSGVPVSFTNHCQAKLLVGLFNDGYRVEELGEHKLVLGWKSRSLISASIWTSISDSDF